MGKDLKGKELGTGLSQRKDGRYTARYTNKEGKRVQKYNFNLSEVKKWLAKDQYEDENDILNNFDEITVNEWFNEWISAYKENIVSISTLNNYKNGFTKYIMPVVGNMQLKVVKPLQLQKLLNDIYNKGLSYGSVNLVKITLNAMFEAAVENDFILKNPTKGVKIIQREVEERRVLTVNEQEEFIKFASKSIHYYAYTLCLQTGLRAGEVGGLKWSDINFDKRTLNVRRTLLFQSIDNGGFYFGNPKTKSSIREIPLTDNAINILNQQKFEQFKLKEKSNNWNRNPLFEDLVFTTINGNPTDPSTFRNNLIRIVTNINNERRAYSKLNNLDFEEFKPMSMHTLRHTFATRCIEYDMKPKILQNILGHSSITMTMDLYVHATEEMKHEEIKKINDIL